MTGRYLITFAIQFHPFQVRGSVPVILRDFPQLLIAQLFVQTDLLEPELLQVTDQPAEPAKQVREDKKAGLDFCGQPGFRRSWDAFFAFVLAVQSPPNASVVRGLETLLLAAQRASDTTLIFLG